MELGNKLSVQAYNAYAERLWDLGETIMSAGYELKGNIQWQDILEQMLLREVPKNYFPHLIKDNIFNPQEEILETIDDAVDWINPYSQKGFRFGRKNGALYPYVKRWFDWLSYNEKIINNHIQKHQYLFCVESGKEEQIFDINGEQIITIEGYFNNDN